MSDKIIEGGPSGDDPEDRAQLSEWEATMVEWLNEPPERTRPSVVLPQPPYLDRAIEDIKRFMERARPKINKNAIKSVIRGKTGIMRNVLVSTNTGTIWVPANLNMSSSSGVFGDGEIEVPIGIDEPSLWPGRDKPGGGGSGQDRGEDESDIVYMPISYDEFVKLIGLLFDLPWLKATAEDMMLVYSLKVRGKQKTGPMVRLDKQETAMARIARFRATYAARPEEFPAEWASDYLPTVEEFPFNKSDLRYKRVEEKWDPDSKAVIFFEMDSSGSMAGEPLAMCKFFFLLNLIWLRQKYKTVHVVFINHNARAERVRNEAEFFRISDSGGTWFSPAHELVMLIARMEYGGEDWNKYCFHGTDGYAEAASEIRGCIERMIRMGFNYFGYLETNPYGGWGWGANFKTSGMEAVTTVAADVAPHVGFARVSNMEEIPEAMRKIITGDKAAA